MSGPARVAPAARIQRNTTAQRAFAARAEAHLQALRDGFAGRASPEVAARLERLTQALARAPAHRVRLQARGLSPRELRTLDDLAQFPTLSRAELAADWEGFAALDGGAPEGLSLARSSGTTGEPVQVLRDGYDNLHMWTVLRFWLERLGQALPARPRVVLLDALPGGLEYSVRVPLLADGALHRISTGRADALARLLRVRPAVIFTDPAGLHWLLGQPELPEPRLVLTSAQPLSPALRAAFAERVPAPLLDYYASTETGPMAWACARAPGLRHVLCPDVHVEALNGELAVTRLRESVLPLLRYLPGDRGAVTDAPCACGFAGRSITALSGRATCTFARADGAEVDAWSVAWVFKHHPLRAFRLTQRAPDRFQLEIDAAEIDPALLERLRRALEALGFAGVRLDAALADLGPGPRKPEPFRRAFPFSGS